MGDRLLKRMRGPGPDYIVYIFFELFFQVLREYDDVDDLEGWISMRRIIIIVICNAESNLKKDELYQQIM